MSDYDLRRALRPLFAEWEAADMANRVGKGNKDANLNRLIDAERAIEAALAARFEPRAEGLLREAAKALVDTPGQERAALADRIDEFLAVRPEQRAEGLPPFVVRECPNCGAMLRVRQVATPPAPAPLDVDARVVEAFDRLGGMWSWSEDNGYFATGSGWVLEAGRLLREVVGRPARPPVAPEQPEGWAAKGRARIKAWTAPEQPE